MNFQFIYIQLPRAYNYQGYYKYSCITTIIIYYKSGSQHVCWMLFQTLNVQEFLALLSEFISKS